MGSEAIKLSIIDFSNQDLKPGTVVWESVKVEVRKALEEFGCFEALFDKIPVELRNALFDSLAELFDLPLQTKTKNISKKPYRGYVGQYPIAPLYESMGAEEPTSLENVESFTAVLWPQGNSNFSETIQSYSEQLSELDKMVRRMVLESLGLEKYMDEHMDSTDYLLRMMKYTGPQSNETRIGLPAHTDKNIVTILHQNQIKGLEVLTKDGQWIEVSFSPKSFIVMIGDSLHAWTNGRLYSPYHRVMMTGSDPRYSAGLFAIPKADYIIKAPEELVDEEHPLLFKPYHHFEFIRFFYTEAGQKCHSALKTFCGV